MLKSSFFSKSTITYYVARATTAATMTRSGDITSALAAPVVSPALPLPVLPACAD